MATTYRELLAQKGVSPTPLYDGDPGFREQVQTLMQAAGGGPVADNGPTLTIPGRTLPEPVKEVVPNTATVSPGGNVSTSTGLTLKGAIQWAKDNPGKTVVIVAAAAWALHEMFGKKSK